MLLEVEYCQKINAAKFNKPLRMTDDDEPDFKQAKECHICGSKYGEKDIRVSDHCHITGKYRGSAHQACNLKLRINPKEMKIPVIFHNLSGYDSHFIMQEIGSIGKQHNVDINCIANNMEEFMAIMLGKHLAFMNSFQFMASSLRKLHYSKQEFKNNKIDLMKKKGVYPYNFMDCVDKFKEQQLPSKNDFYSLLTGDGISEEQYQHAQKVWNTFGLKNMGEYHDLYLKSDILLLADVFENFRKYLDTNNLCGWAISQYLPTGGFRWVTEKQIE